MYIGCASTKRSMLLVASLSSLPSPPFRLRRRRKGAAGYIPPEDASPRRYHSNQPFRYNQSAITLQTTTATPTFTTTSLLLPRGQPPTPPPLPQPVCSYQAADDHRNPYLYCNQSAAIVLQTTTATTFTATSLQLSRCRRLPQPLPLPQPVCSYRAADNHYTIGAQ